jgi:hypothetical protein
MSSIESNSKFDGWRYASYEEVKTLFLNISGETVSNYNESSTGDITFNSDRTAVQRAQNLFGKKYD